MTFDINDPEDKKLFEEAVKKAVADEYSGLTAKRDELLDEVKKLKAGRSDNEVKLTDLQAKLDEIENERARKAGNFEKIEQDLRDKHADEIKKLTDQLTTKTNSINELLIDNGLKTALVDVNVDKKFLPGAEALLRNRVTVTDDNGKLSATVDGKPLAEFIKGWAESEEGSAYIRAAENKGSGAPGGTKAGDNRTKQSEFTMGELSQMRQEDPARYKAVINNK